MISAGLGLSLTLALVGAAPPAAGTVAFAPASARAASHVSGARYANIGSDVAAMLAALNERRTSRGLRPLVLEPRLCAIARAHAADMAARRYFDHVSPEGATPFERLDRAHYRYGYAGENLALDRDANAAESALWQSLPHRENILEPHYVNVGIAAVAGPQGELFVEDFSD